MELNHQIRLCRPSPFLFGFRAISHNADLVTKMNQGVTAGPGSHQFSRVVPGAILVVPAS
jgi:hypothetical protein